MTQNEMILQYCRDFGSISTYEAFTELGITRLASRIAELISAGFKFRKVRENRKNRYGEPVTFVRYYLEV